MAPCGQQGGAGHPPTIAAAPGGVNRGGAPRGRAGCWARGQRVRVAVSRSVLVLAGGVVAAMGLLFTLQGVGLVGGSVMTGDTTLFQRADNVEAGWAAVQPILDEWEAGHIGVQSYAAGTAGPASADALLQRASGDVDNPRILGAFNEKTPDWLAFFMYTYFTDRDGKFQLAALAESAFDPLARTTKFMLTEEAHHMFVGESGISRTISRTCQVMNELKTDDVEKIRAAGVIDLPTIQKFMNFWFTSSLDLFGSEASSNAANYFSNGIKGRPDEARFADHVERDTEMSLQVPDGKGRCPDNTLPVYRFFDNRRDANHRYTVDLSVHRAMQNRSWVAEGARGVAFCSPI